MQNHFFAMAKTAHPAPVAANFEAALTELESIVQDMENGQLSLENSLAAYRRGAELLKYCQQTLTSAEQQIAVLEAGELRPLPAGPNA